MHEALLEGQACDRPLGRIARTVRPRAENARISPSVREPAVTGKGGDLNVDYQREAPLGAVFCFWAATLIGSWTLLILAVAGIWWAVT